MPCVSCAVQFSVFRRKRACTECDRFYCGGCLRRGGGAMCASCRVLSTRPLMRHALTHMKVRDLQYFLHRQNVSTRGCVEKEDLVNLVVSHVNSAEYQRRPAQQNRNSNNFTYVFSSSIKGFTSNINNLITNAFDMRHNNADTAPRTTANCYNSAHSHEASSAPNANAPSSSGYTARTTTQPERPTARPQAQNVSPQSHQPTGTNNVASHIPTDPPEGTPEVIVSDASQDDLSVPSEHRDTADCLEIEDLDDAAEWEFVRRPAEPLPTGSSVLLTDNNLPTTSDLTARAASELDLRHSESNDSITDTSSLKDESFVDPEGSIPKRIRLEDLKALTDLENLNVKQLKELLILNRVDFKGCVERKELLERAKRLFRESMKSREDLDNLSMEDACKICMDAPMECILLECGHIAACTACSKRLSECPICRQYVVRVVRFFRT